METDRQGFQLGDWRVYPDQGLLEGVDGQVHLEPKVMGVLVYLAEHQGEVVRRTDLIDHIWSGTIVSDEVLSRAISVLRNNLVDDRMSPSYIQTLPKVGYRLLMPITSLVENETETDAGLQKHRVRIWAVAIVFSIAAIVAIIVWTGEGDVVDPRSPAAHADISDWFDYLVEAKEGSAGVTSIAVLPFDDLSESGESVFFSEGLTDELTMSLSKVKGLKVVARRSSYSFKNRNDDVPTIGRLLNADAIFEGTIRREGDQLRINAQLCDVSDGFLIWSDIYERDVSDVFDVRENIAAAVVEAMRGHYKDGSLQTPLTKQAPPNMEAYQLYLMNGNFMWRLRGEQPLRNSIDLYRQALAIDPSFSRAYISLANALVILPFYSAEPMEPMFQQALEVLESFQFSESRELGEVEAIHGFIAWNRWQWVKAEEHFRKALELAPDSPNVYQWYSQLLSGVGRNKDGLKAAKRARDLDQISPVINDRLAMAYLWVGDNVRAAEQFAIGAQLGFRNAINPGYMVFLARQQRFNEFKAIMAAMHRGSPNPPTWIIENADIVLLKENREQALELATEADKAGSFSRPFVRFGLWIEIGGVDQAYEAFNALRDKWPQFLQLEFIFSQEAREFREDPRFEELAEEIGWQEYWKIYGGPDKD